MEGDDENGAFALRGVDLTSTEILKVAHHGSETSTSFKFLEYLNVQTAIISCGENNFYGHPNQRVLESLSAVGASIHRTDVQGTIVVTIQQTGKYILT